MKKILSLLAALVLTITLSACGGSTKDGSYIAMDNNPGNGWQTLITFDVKEGKITNTKIDSINMQSGHKETKNQESKNGKYVLTKPNKGEMDVQHEVISKYIDEHGGLNNIKFNDEGKSDAISGATISYSELPALIDQAKKAGPLEEKGKLVDGIYYATGAKDKDGYIPTAGYYVANGKIIGANIDAMKAPAKEGERPSFKSTESKAAEEKGDKSEEAPFYEQALAFSKYVIENQGVEHVEMSDDVANNIDGVTMPVKAYVDLIKNAKKIN